MTIRNAVLSDLPYLYSICRRTGYNGGDASELVGDPNLLGHLFAAPYVVHALEWCWVVVEDGLPVGYFVSTPDTAIFYDWMEQVWVPPLREYDKNTDGKSASEFETMLKGMVRANQKAPLIAKEYPAHLHMALLPEFQRQGIGTKLFSLFHQRVKDFGVQGVYIGVVKGNPGAMTFYQKQGYSKCQVEDWGIYFGRKV
jgi:GNAT superfamily N-acetyltransferase